MEGLHPVNRGRRCIPNPKIGFEHPPGLASKRRTRSSAHIRVLLVVRTLEDAWSTMLKGGVGRRATLSYFGTVGDPIGRGRPSDRCRAGNTQSMRARLTEHQQILLDKLGLRLPTRIREGKMVWKRKSQNQCFHCSVASCWGRWVRHFLICIKLAYRQCRITTSVSDST